MKKIVCTLCCGILSLACFTQDSLISFPKVEYYHLDFKQEIRIEGDSLFTCLIANEEQYRAVFRYTTQIQKDTIPNVDFTRFNLGIVAICRFCGNYKGVNKTDNPTPMHANACSYQLSFYLRKK